MRTLGKLTAASAILVLFGCQTVEVTKSVGRPVPTTRGFLTPSTTVKRCPEGNCLLAVRVLDCRAGRFEIDGDILTLGGFGGGRQRVVVWILETAGYEFSTDPKLPALEPKGSEAFFGRPKVAEVVLVARVKLAHPGQSHEYGLNIVPAGGGTPCGTFDPWMIE